MVEKLKYIYSLQKTTPLTPWARRQKGCHTDLIDDVYIEPEIKRFDFLGQGLPHVHKIPLDDIFSTSGNEEIDESLNCVVMKGQAGSGENNPPEENVKRLV